MSVELLESGQNTVNRFLPEGKKPPLIPPSVNLRQQHLDSLVPAIAQSRPKLFHDVTKAQEAWKRKNEPGWERQEKLVTLARKKDFLKELSAKQQEAIAAIFPESGGHNSVKEAAEKLHKSVPAIHSALHVSMKQLENKETTGKFLKQGRPRRPVEDSNSEGNKLPMLTRREKERKIVMEAIKAGTFYQLPKSQQEALMAKCLGKKGLLEESLDRRIVWQRKQDGLRNLLNLENGKPILKGRPRKPREPLMVDSNFNFRRSKGIETEAIRRKTNNVSMKVARRIGELASQGKKLSEIIANLQSDPKNKYSRYLVLATASRLGIEIKRSGVGQPRKMQTTSI